MPTPSLKIQLARYSFSSLTLNALGKPIYLDQFKEVIFKYYMKNIATVM